MTEKITIDLPEDIMQQVRTVAARTQRSFEEVLVEWIRRAGAEPVMELLPDEELLTVCDSHPDLAQQEELSELLEGNQEGGLLDHEKCRLEDLMRSYRTGLVRKSQAIKVAVSRGLRPRLS